MSEDKGKPQPEEIDPAQLMKLLEIELMQKRAGWQQVEARGKRLRAISFFFLFIVVLAVLVGFFFLFSSGRMSAPPVNPEDSASPAASALSSER